MAISLAAQFFWVASPTLQLLLATLMLRRRLQREYPLFFAYTVFRAVTALLLYVLFQHHFVASHWYGYGNWIHEIGCIILRFGVIYELFTVVLSAYSALKDTADKLYRVGIVVLLILAVVVAISQRLGPYASPLAAGLNLIDRTADIVQCGLLLALIFFSRYLRLSWRSFGFGIAIGLGVFATVDLAAAAILLESARVPAVEQVRLQATMSLISMGAYLLCVVVWLVYALLRDPVPHDPQNIPEHDLEDWSQELQRLLQR